MEVRPWQLLVVERLDCRCELDCGGSRFSYPQWGLACSSFYPHSHPQISASSMILCTFMTLKTAEEASLFPNACPLRHLFKPLAPITEVAQLRAHTHCEHLSPLCSFLALPSLSTASPHTEGGLRLNLKQPLPQLTIWFVFDLPQADVIVRVSITSDQKRLGGESVYFIL